MCGDNASSLLLPQALKLGFPKYPMHSTSSEPTLSQAVFSRFKGAVQRFLDFSQLTAGINLRHLWNEEQKNRVFLRTL